MQLQEHYSVNFLTFKALNSNRVTIIVLTYDSTVLLHKTFYPVKENSN
jgi:hypothetical protein